MKIAFIRDIIKKNREGFVYFDRNVKELPDCFILEDSLCNRHGKDIYIVRRL